MSDESSASVSVLVLTLNEETNLAACLQSVRWSDDVVVLDSFSTDRTVEIANQCGARVVQRAFDNYANQRNFALQEVAFRHRWVLMVDADERVPLDLQSEIARTVREAPADVAMYRMRRKDHLFGRWIRASSGYPTWFGRLVRIGRVRVERAINEEYHADGRWLNLEKHLEHFPFNKGFAAWFAKHDRYSTLEAELRVGSQVQSIRFAQLFDRDPTVRRRVQKVLAYRVPGRPMLIFLVLYFVRGGIWEGRAGLTFSLLRAWYEFMIDCKCAELECRRLDQPV